MQSNALKKWHSLLEHHDDQVLYDLLADDVVFISPVVHTPQLGKRITHAYLTAANKVLNSGHFEYCRTFETDSAAVLEFETKIGDVSVNGIDIISWDANDQITEFKVMVRPLKAMQALHAAMGAELERLAKAQQADGS